MLCAQTDWDGGEQGHKEGPDAQAHVLLLAPQVHRVEQERSRPVHLHVRRECPGGTPNNVALVGKR